MISCCNIFVAALCTVYRFQPYFILRTKSLYRSEFSFYLNQDQKNILRYIEMRMQDDENPDFDQKIIHDNPCILVGLKCLVNKLILANNIRM